MIGLAESSPSPLICSSSSLLRSTCRAALPASSSGTSRAPTSRRRWPCGPWPPSAAAARRRRPSRIVLLPAVRRDGTRLPRRLWHRVRGHRAQMDRFVLTDASHSAAAASRCQWAAVQGEPSRGLDARFKARRVVASSRRWDTHHRARDGLHRERDEALRRASRDPVANAIGCFRGGKNGS